MNKIPLHQIHLIGNEQHYINQTLQSGLISGDGLFTKQCQEYFEKKYHFKKCLLTSSCTDALEMAALLINIQSEDEVIIPSFTFPSTANAFLLQGAKIIFADSNSNHPNIDVVEIEKLITKKTKAIIVVHYAGVACDMDSIMALASKYNLFVVEDAAQCIDSFYKDKPLGSLGHLATFSFHATKNITCGEGGMLIINDEKLIHRAEIIRDKGTSKAQFIRGEIDKYELVDIGSSFLMSEISAAFLMAQLESMNEIQALRKEKWNYYFRQLNTLSEKGYFKLPFVPAFANGHNAHIFYLECKNEKERNALIGFLKQHHIQAAFHYQPLHLSSFYLKNNQKENLLNAEKFASTIIRLPLFTNIKTEEIDFVISKINDFFRAV